MSNNVNFRSPFSKYSNIIVGSEIMNITGFKGNLYNRQYIYVLVMFLATNRPYLGNIALTFYLW